MVSAGAAAVVVAWVLAAEPTLGIRSTSENTMPTDCTQSGSAV